MLLQILTLLWDMLAGHPLRVQTHWELGTRGMSNENNNRPNTRQAALEVLQTWREQLLRARTDDWYEILCQETNSLPYWRSKALEFNEIASVLDNADRQRLRQAELDLGSDNRMQRVQGRADSLSIVNRLIERVKEFEHRSEDSSTEASPSAPHVEQIDTKTRNENETVSKTEQHVSEDVLPSNNLLLSVSEAANFIGKSRNTLYRWQKEGETEKRTRLPKRDNGYYDYVEFCSWCKQNKILYFRNELPLRIQQALDDYSELDDAAKDADRESKLQAENLRKEHFKKDRNMD